MKDAKCVFLQEEIDLKVIPVCTKKEVFINLKNIHKNSAVYQVAYDKLPPYTEVLPLKDKVLLNETKFLKVD